MKYTLLIGWNSLIFSYERGALYQAGVKHCSFEYEYIAIKKARVRVLRYEWKSEYLRFEYESEYLKFEYEY